MSVLAILIAVFAPAGLSGLTWHLDRRYNFFFSWFGGGVGGAFGYVAAHAWIPAVLCAANALIAVLAWWLNRRKRKRSAKLIGAKSRAVLAAVVARMRATARPRQVFRPAPGGTRG